MGRQIRFYMLPSDLQFFFHSILQFPDVKIIYERPKESKVEEVDEQTLSGLDTSDLSTLLIWDSKLPIHSRHIKTAHWKRYDDESASFEPTGEISHYVDKKSSPVIEFSPSFAGPDGRIENGRLWAQTRYVLDHKWVDKGQEFQAFFDKIARVIRKDFHRIKGADGYYGPEFLSAIHAGKITVTHYGCYFKEQ